MDENSSIYEKKLNILNIPYTLLCKTMIEQSSATQFMLDVCKKFILVATRYLLSFSPLKKMPCCSLLTTQLITYVNRVIVVNKDWFMQHILQELHNESLTFEVFVSEWFKRMDFITSRESLRINLVAIYTLLPHFSVELLKQYFGEVGKLTFNQLDTFMYLKLTNNNSRFYSPSKIAKDNCVFPYGGHAGKGRLNIHYAEKVS